MPELTPQQKAQLDTNIRAMLSQGASESDVTAYANDFRTKYDVPSKKKESSVVSDVLSAGGSLASFGEPSELDPLSITPTPVVETPKPVIENKFFLKGNKAPEPITDLRPAIDFNGNKILVKADRLPEGYQKTPEGARLYATDLTRKIQTSELANDPISYNNALKEVSRLAALNRMDDNDGVLTPNDFSEIDRIIKAIPAKTGLSGALNPDTEDAAHKKPTEALLQSLIERKRSLELLIKNTPTANRKAEDLRDLAVLNRYTEKLANVLQPEVDAEQESVVKSADTRSDLNKMLTGIAKEAQAQMNLYNKETLNNSFFTGLESLKYKDRTMYDNIKNRLSKGKTLASTEVASLTATGAKIIDGKNLQQLNDGHIDVDQYAEKYDKVIKQQNDNFYKRPDVLTRSIANVIGEYYAHDGTQMLGKWSVSDKEIDAVPLWAFEAAGIDISRPEAKEAIRKIKDNEGVLPFDNAVQKDSYVRELGKGFIAPIKGIAKAIENAPKGDNELLVEHKLEPITDYEKQRTEYFQKNYGKIADAFNGAGQFVSQYLLMIGGAGALKGIGRAIGGSTEVALVTSPEAAATGTGIRQGNIAGNFIMDNAQVYSNLAVPFVQTYDANFKSALEKTNNPLAARAIAFTNSSMESLSEQMFNNVKFGNAVIADFNGKNFGKIAKIFDRQVFDEVAGRELRNTIKEGLEGSIKAVAKGAGGLAQEAFEEVPVQFADFVTSALADPESVKDRHLLPELKDAFVSGLVSFSIPSLIGVAGRIKRQFSNNNTQDDALMLAARNRDMVMEAIFSQLEDGGISQPEADHKIQVLNTAVAALHNMPPVYANGEQLTEADRSKYLSLSVQEKLISQQIHKAEDPALNDANQVRLDEIKAKKTSILTGVTEQPVTDAAAVVQYDETLTPEEKKVVDLVNNKKELADLSDTALGRIIFDSMQDPATQKEAIQILIDQSSDPGALELNVGAKVTDAVLGLQQKSTQLTPAELAPANENNVTTVAANEISKPIDLVPVDTSQPGVKVIGANEISPTVELNPNLPEDVVQAQEQSVLGSDVEAKIADIEKRRNEELERGDVTWDNLIKVGNTINFDGKQYTIGVVRHSGKARQNGGYFEVFDREGNKIFDEGFVGHEDSYVLYQNGRKGKTKSASEINSKYDAELSELEKQQPNETIPQANKAGKQNVRFTANTMAIVNKFGVTPEVATQIEGIAAQATDLNEFKTMVKELLGKSRTLEASQGQSTGTNLNLEGVNQQQYDDIRNRAAGLEGQEIVEFTPSSQNNVEVARGLLENAGGVVWQEFPNEQRMDAAGLRAGAANTAGTGNRGSQTGSVNTLHQLGFGEYPGSNQKNITGQTLGEILTGPDYTDEQRGMAASYIAASRLLSESPTDVVARIFSRAANSSKDSRGRIRIISNLNPEAPLIAASDLGFIVLNAAKLGNRLKEFGGENKFLRWLDSALQEEVLHLATFKVTSQAELTAVAQEMTPEQKQAVKDLYNPATLPGKEMTDFQMASEYLRMLIQERMSGVSTELFKPPVGRSAVRRVFAKLLAFLKNTFRGTTNPKATEIVSRIESFVKGEDVPTVAAGQGNQAAVSDNDIDAALEDMWNSMKGEKPRSRFTLQPVMEGDPIENFVLKYGEKTIVQDVMRTHERRDNTYEGNPADYEREEIAIKATAGEMDNLVAEVLSTKGIGPGALYLSGKFSDKNIPQWVKNVLSVSLNKMLRGRPDIANNIRLNYDKKLATESALGLFSRRDFTAEEGATDEQQEQIMNATAEGKNIVAAKKILKEALDTNDIPPEVEQAVADKTHEQAKVDVEQAKAAMREKKVNKKLSTKKAKFDSATYSTKAKMADVNMKNEGRSKQSIIDKIKEVIKKC